MGKTNIEWSAMVWNPTTGCTKVSNGCLRCYAETIDRRFQRDGPHVPWTVRAQAKAGGPAIHLRPDRLEAPLHWRKPLRVFVNSVSDLFHEQVPDSFIHEVWNIMAQTPQHTYQILTKRPGRMLGWLTGVSYPEPIFSPWPLPNVWLGVSVENQRWADERLPILVRVPARVRFVSVEPLLGPMDLKPYFFKCSGTCVPTPENPTCACKGLAIHQVIIGGESGPGARPMDLAWARDLVGQCQKAGTACFVKQLGRNPIDSEILWDSVDGRGHMTWDTKGADPSEWPQDLRLREFPT